MPIAEVKTDMSNQPQGRRERNRADKRARIITAARALFTTKGFAATTTKEVARAAGVASGTVFTYAKTKEELLIVVFHDEMIGVVEEGLARARALRSQALGARLMAFFKALVDYHEQDLDLARALMRELAYVESAEQRALVDALLERIFAALHELLADARASGEISPSCPSQIAARSVFASYYFALGALLNTVTDRAIFERTLRSDFGLLLKGLKDYKADPTRLRTEA